MQTPKTSFADLDSKTVQELQALAASAARPANGTKAGRKLSRAARLHLIDQLSRWGGSGLALFAGAAIFIALVIARDIPVRTAIFASLIFASLYLCRRYRKEFRRGDHISSHPFRWRAYYTSTLTVVSAAFGAGAFLLLPDSVGATGAYQILALMVVATLGAAAFHSTHLPSAAAAGLPAFAAVISASIATFGMSLFSILMIVAGAAGASFVALASFEAEKRAVHRFPRTTLARREIERRAKDQPGVAERAAS